MRRMAMVAMRAAAVLLLGLGSTLAACSDAAGSNTSTGGASSGGSGAIGIGGSGGSGAIGTGASSGSGGLAGGCASDTYDGELVPLDMYVMLDKSGSMGDSGAWTGVTSAITQFVKLPGIDGLGMGLGFFPVPPNPQPPLTCQTSDQCGTGGVCFGFVCTNFDSSCEPTDYNAPKVGIAPLPGVGSAITSAIVSVSPNGGTPSTPALQGAMMYALDWSKANPDHITVVVLATDGEPAACDPAANNVQTVSAVAAQGLAATPSVRTFVIGIGDLSALNAVAQAGGTDQAIIVSAGNAAQDFLAALNKIRGAVGCVYSMPVSSGGQTDPAKVNVAFTPEGGEQELFPKVDNASQCQGQKAWYYDDNSSPSQIILCPAACDLVTNTKGKVDVVIGCATIVT